MRRQRAPQTMSVSRMPCTNESESVLPCASCLFLCNYCSAIRVLRIPLFACCTDQPLKFAMDSRGKMHAQSKMCPHYARLTLCNALKAQILPYSVEKSNGGVLRAPELECWGFSSSAYLLAGTDAISLYTRSCLHH